VIEHAQGENAAAQFLDLSSQLAEGGNNLSQGQLQLMCLARSVLKSPKVLLLDDATTSVDYETDARMQKTIREEFTQTTILTIAHRLRSIIDYDKILVMEAGEAVEYDAPHTLLQNTNSVAWSQRVESF
jgi:ABC-type multidrug transport system fused ATPase/permease subunit